MNNPFGITTYIYSPKEYGAKVIGTDSSGRYVVQILEDNHLEFFIYHSSPPATACIKWRQGYLEYACNVTI